MSTTFNWLWTFLGVAGNANHIWSKLGWSRTIFGFCESFMVSIELVKSSYLYFSLRNLWRRLIARVWWILWIYWFLLENAILINDPALSSFLLHLLLLRDEWLIYELQVTVIYTRWILRSVCVKWCDSANLTWRLRRYHFFLFTLFINHVMTRLHVTLGLARSEGLIAGLNPRDNIDKGECFTVEVP